MDSRFSRRAFEWGRNGVFLTDFSYAVRVIGNGERLRVSRILSLCNCAIAICSSQRAAAWLSTILAEFPCRAKLLICPCDRVRDFDKRAKFDKFGTFKDPSVSAD
jgi:hypothetical protein